MKHESGIFRLTQCGSVLARYLGGFGRTYCKHLVSVDPQWAPLAGAWQVRTMRLMNPATSAGQMT